MPSQAIRIPQRVISSRLLNPVVWLLPLETQEIGLRPFVGMRVDFLDGWSEVSDVAPTRDRKGLIALVPFAEGWRSLFYVPKEH